MKKLLIVDDESSILNSLSFAFEDCYDVFTAEDDVSAYNIISKEEISIALIDLRIGNTSGIDVLKNIKRANIDAVIIIMTAFGSIETAIEATKEGAFYYITKPIDIESLKLLLEKAAQYEEMNKKVKYLSSQVTKVNSRFHIIGNSKKMEGIYEIIDIVKDIDSNVLITGESGTGKELVARAIHFEGKRKDKPFIVINCSAIPQALLESELFGYTKGSFTGASQDRVGLIELSDGGTLFLDEIGDMDFNLQAKLLRVLQDKIVTPIGSNKNIKVDVRFIAATNKNLKDSIIRKEFRDDLYYRLNVINIEIPSLKERYEDIPLLIKHFITIYSAKLGKTIDGITYEAIHGLENYSFPGNVRELENLIERSVALTKNEYIKKVDLPDYVFSNDKKNIVLSSGIDIKVGEDLTTIEKKVIEATLKECGGNRRITSEILGISERALRYKIKEYNLD